MTVKRPGRRGGTLTSQSKGDPSLNPYGRPKKFISTLKDYGYKLCEVHDTMQVLLALKKCDLENVAEKASSTILERIVAQSLVKAAKKGDLSTIETLLTRVYGKPAESKSPEQKDDDYSNLTPEQLAVRIADAFKRSKNNPANEPDKSAGDDKSADSAGNRKSKT